MQRYFKVSESQENGCPISASTLYRWKCTKQHLQIFSKVGGFLLVDRDMLTKLFESNRLSDNGTKPIRRIAR